MTLSMPYIPAGGHAARSAGHPVGQGNTSTAAPFLNEFLALLTPADPAGELDAPTPAGMVQTVSDSQILVQAAPAVTPVSPRAVEPLPEATVLAPEAPANALPPLGQIESSQPQGAQTDLAEDSTSLLAEGAKPLQASAEDGVSLPDIPLTTDQRETGPLEGDLPVTDPSETDDALPLKAEDAVPPPPIAVELVAEHLTAQPTALPTIASENPQSPPLKGAAKTGQGDGPAVVVLEQAPVAQAGAAASGAAPLSLTPLASPLVAASSSVVASAAPLRAAPLSASPIGAASQAAPQTPAAHALPAKALSGEGRGLSAALHLLPEAPVAPPAPFDAAVGAVAEGAVDPAASMPAPSAAPAASAPPPVVMTDRADWPQTVVSATLAELTPDGGTMTLELAPEELGALRIVLTLEGDSASVQIQTETPEAARLLNEAQRHLVQDFARQGITLSSHDAQSGRREDQTANGANRAGRGTEQDTSTDLAAPMRLTGTINLIA